MTDVTPPKNPRRSVRHFSVGTLISESFRVALANMAPFFLIVFLCHIPSYLWKLWPIISNTPVGITDDGKPSWVYWMSGSLIGFFLGTIAQAALVYGTVQFLSGHRLPFSDCLTNGFSRVLPVMGVAILFTLLIMLGLICLIIPGLILICTLYVSIPASVMESPGIRGALYRSAELTKGYRGSLFFAIFGLFLLSFLVSYILGNVGALNHNLFGNIVQEAVSIFFTTITSVLSAVAYTQLRELKDGVDIVALAKVFD